MENTANLDLPYIMPSQAQKHVTHNEALSILDALVQLSVVSATVATPPGSPAEGQRWVVPAGATGAWSGQAGKIAAWYDGAWLFLAPRQGWTAYSTSATRLLAFDGAAWVDAINIGIADITTLGVNTTADATNRLAVKSNGVVLSHDDVTPGTGHMRMTVNKSAAARDAGITLQDGFSTRTLLGLLGDDNFTIKVSPDGSSFSAGLNIRKEDGHVGLAGYTADAGNDVGVKATSILFDNRTNHIRALFNKAAVGNDASFGFQTGFSTRALYGLLGDDDLTIRASPDGSNFFTGIRQHRLLHGRTALRDAWRKHWALWLAYPGSASFGSFGLAQATTGTATLANPSASNLFTQSPRVKFVSGASAGSSAGVNGTGLWLWRGNAGSQGGFYLCMRGGIETFQANSRMFMGLYASATAIANVNPSTLLNMIGIGYDSGQATLRLFRNDGSGTATATDLGANFPTNSGQTLYELILSCEPNGAEVQYRVENLNSGAVAEGTLSADLPASTSFMTPHMWMNNGTTAAAIEIAVSTMYAENASMLGSRGSVG